MAIGVPVQENSDYNHAEQSGPHCSDGNSGQPMRDHRAFDVVVQTRQIRLPVLRPQLCCLLLPLVVPEKLQVDGIRIRIPFLDLPTLTISHGFLLELP